LRHDRARGGGQDLLGPGDRALHPLLRRSQLQLRAEQLEHLAPLDRHALGHAQDQAVALGGGDEGQGDARVARGRLDQGGAGLQPALRLELLDHRHADAVLDAAHRVEELELGDDLRLRLQLGRKPRQAHQRGVADGLEQAVVDAAPSGTAVGFGVVGAGCGVDHGGPLGFEARTRPKRIGKVKRRTP
jgi:hypothetical protein